MDLTPYNSFLGQFISNMGFMRQMARQTHTELDLSNNEHWLAAAPQRKILDGMCVLLTENGMISVDGENRIGIDGPPISPEILRAMAADAGTLMQMAMMGSSPSDGWWYDPTLPDGLTDYYPGRAHKPNQI
ncbi:MAG: hypothetical protein JWQ16_1715 [Novosphingobium sp.]|nr:hypothetical protein [Novosphingobium sp.]